MQAANFIDKAKDPKAWRKHARALRQSADVLWGEFGKKLIAACLQAKEHETSPELEATLEFFETTKLLYGLALETALKAWIIKHDPSKIELRVIIDGRGEATSAELKTVGVSSSQGHNLLALAEAAGIFSVGFNSVLKTDNDRSAMRNICRDLGEVVVWRGRYPIPLASYEPMQLDPNVPNVAVAHYMRDWLDPILNALLQEK